jgi:nucleotide-binding universal stress UspA family protein
LRHFVWNSIMRQQQPEGFRSIVCGIDFSRHSAMALRYAAALARASHAHLVAVFAVDPFLSAAAAAAYDTRALTSTALLELRRFVRTTLGAGATGTLGCEVVIGKPARAIVAAAERADADVLVLGTHGLSGVKKAFFGSTSDAILRRTALPVLAIPRRCRAPRRTWPLAGAVAAVHFEDHAAQDAAALSDIAAALGAPFDLVVTVPNVRVPLWVRVNEPPVTRQRIAAAQAGPPARRRAGPGDGYACARRRQSRRHRCVRRRTGRGSSARDGPCDGGNPPHDRRGHRLSPPVSRALSGAGVAATQTGLALGKAATAAARRRVRNVAID